MGRGRGCPITPPPRFTPLAPPPLFKQQLIASFFHLTLPLSDPYLDLEPVCAKPYETRSKEDDDARAHYEDDYDAWDNDYYDDYDSCDYDDARWEALVEEHEARNVRRGGRAEHLSKERLALERVAGKQRHLHASVRQIRRAESKMRSKHTSDRACSLDAPAVPQYHVSYATARHAPTASRVRNSSAATIRTSTGRSVQLSKEEQDVAAAIQASLAADANVAGGLSMAQIAELLTRDLSPNDYEMLLLLDESVQKKTLSVEAIEKLPQRLATEADQSVKCTICQCEYETGETLQSTPCQHLFHADCLMAWLTKSSTKCALCNHSLESTA